MPRDRAHYIDMLDRNPNATIGASLAAKMVVAANGHVEELLLQEAERMASRRLRREYGETLTNAQVRAEMGIDCPTAAEEEVGQTRLSTYE